MLFCNYLEAVFTGEAFGKTAHRGDARNASLTVLDGGEHWFHTPEQMRFLDDWIRKLL